MKVVLFGASGTVGTAAGKALEEKRARGHWRVTKIE